jgi:hypothetical protein
MARYTCVLTVNASMSGPKRLLRDILEACNFRIVHEAGDYLMASEIPGQVEFMKLVTAEVLIDHTQATEQELQMKCVVKNEELPLHTDNHCRRVFERLNDAIAQSGSVESIQTVTG